MKIVRNVGLIDDSLHAHTRTHDTSHTADYAVSLSLLDLHHTLDI